ncbi:MAG: DUF2971 domain-containing protein [Candidatus Zixiibacteriota bacterium]
MDVPPVLYKYRSWGCQHSKDALRSRTIRFTNPLEFNDPFDGRLPNDYRNLPVDEMVARVLADEQFFDRVQADLRSQGVTISNDQIVKMMRDEDVIEITRTRNNGNFDEQLAIERNSTIGIFPVTPVNDSVLMWSHYADSHKGFCIGYSMPGLIDEFDRLEAEESTFISHFRVRYVPDLPVLDVTDHSDPNWLWRQFITKADYWSYETEHRFLLPGKTNTLITLPPQVITEIVFGALMTIPHQEEIRSLLREAGVTPRYYAAKMSKGRYRLNIIAFDQ